ncbi:MAG: AlpA family phage regulatory protein [Candidatus Ozemobacteraceae bacterium]
MRNPDLLVMNPGGKGLCRSFHIASDRGKGWIGMSPFSRSHFWALVKAGKAPQPVRISSRITCWRIEEILAWVESLQKGGE